MKKCDERREERRKDKKGGKVMMRGDGKENKQLEEKKI